MSRGATSCTGLSARRIMDLRERTYPAGKRPSAPLRGVRVVSAYTERSGKNLPKAFWIYYNDWCKAWNSQNQPMMEELRAHRDAKQYSEWIDEVKRVLSA